MPFDALPEYSVPPTEDAVLMMRRIERLLSRPSRWTQGNIRTGRWWHRYCAVGAIGHVKARYRFTDREAAAVREALDSGAQRHGYKTIISLNDCDNTTHEYLISVVRETLNHMESQYAFATR